MSELISFTCLATGICFAYSVTFVVILEPQIGKCMSYCSRPFRALLIMACYIVGVFMDIQVMNWKGFVQVKIYTADGVTCELEKSKLDYLQASIVVTTTKIIMIPHFLVSSMHEFATDLDSLVHWIINQLPTSWPLRKSMLEFLKGHTPGKISLVVDVIPSVSEIQYLLPMWVDISFTFFLVKFGKYNGNVTI